MLTCPEARTTLLDAEPSELDGTGDGALAAHLRACAGCRAAADRLLAVTDALRAERAVRPRRSAVAAADLAWAHARRGPRARRARWALIPLVAAAGLATILLVRPRPETDPPVASRPLPSPPLVESPAARVAVFTTDNPTIVVVWQF